MVKKKRQYSAEFKAKVALSAIREEGTLQQLSSHYGVNANVISKWKQQALAQMSDLFSNKRERQDFDQEETAQKVLSLPLDPNHTEKEIMFVIKKIKEFFGG